MCKALTLRHQMHECSNINKCHNIEKDSILVINLYEQF